MPKTEIGAVEGRKALEQEEADREMVGNAEATRQGRENALPESALPSQQTLGRMNRTMSSMQKGGRNSSGSPKPRTGMVGNGRNVSLKVGKQHRTGGVGGGKVGGKENQPNTGVREGWWGSKGEGYLGG